MAVDLSTGSDILILVHKLAALGDNAVCAAHKVCSMLLQNGGKNIIGQQPAQRTNARKCMKKTTVKKFRWFDCALHTDNNMIPLCYLQLSNFFTTTPPTSLADYLLTQFINN